MSMIFQDPMTYLSPVYPVGSMMADVATPHSGGKDASWWDVLKNLLGRRDNREEIRERSAELLERMRIPDPEGTLDRYPVELSGGMRQRVIVAMALINDPEFLIADEPTTALDVTVQNQILDLLRERVEERNLSMLYITHNLGVAGRSPTVSASCTPARSWRSAARRRSSTRRSTRTRAGCSTASRSSRASTAPESTARFRTTRTRPRAVGSTRGVRQRWRGPVTSNPSRDYEIGDGRTVACHLYEDGMDFETAAAIASDEATYHDDGDDDTVPAEAGPGGTQ